MTALLKRNLKEPAIKLYVISTKNVLRVSRPTALLSLEMFFRLISMKLIVFKKNWPSVKNLSIEFRAKILKRCRTWMLEKNSWGKTWFSKSWRPRRLKMNSREPDRSWASWNNQNPRTRKMYVSQIDINQVLLLIERTNIDTNQLLMDWTSLGTTLKYEYFSSLFLPPLVGVSTSQDLK